ncbi:MAG: hypothetical protein ABSC04_13695 [Syntrophobacteraceae bacterium]|jgi:hypothetical protein
MSNDDHVLAASELTTRNPGVIVFAVLEERFLKRTPAVFTVDRPISLFGRVAHKGKHFLGIQLVSIALS